MSDAEKIMGKKAAIKAELDKCLPKQQSDELWQKATGKLDEILRQYAERIYGNLPGLRFERTGTLGKGDERCDFRIRKV